MGSVDLLPDLLSLDVTAGLVKQGLRAPWKQPATTGGPQTFTLPILNASNTSPIVLTIPANSLRTDDAVQGVAPGLRLHVVVEGVGGNTAANKLDDPKSARNEAWVAVVVDATHLALYDLDNSTGERVDSQGSGAYTSGGTLSKALMEAKILLGQEHIKDNTFAPRIVMVPSRVTYEPATALSAFTVAALSEGEVDRIRLKDSIRTKVWWYRVHVWGIAAPGTVEGVKRSFGAVELLHDQIIRSAHSRFSGVSETMQLNGGPWMSQGEGAPQRVQGGQELAFELGLSAPITREPLIFAADDADVDVTMLMQIAGGSPEEA